LNIDIEKLWYSKNILSIFLLPFSWLFRLVVHTRRFYYQVVNSNVAKQAPFVIVVGNITVGGVGKTPFVAYLAHRCQRTNLNVGIVSRGYGRADEHTLIEVLGDSSVVDVGDEALMLRHQVTCPIVVSADRCRAVEYLREHHQVDVVISDDGLQHYKLVRDAEIVIVDGVREFGNGYCLPAGPLREPPSRLKSVDMVVSNGKNPKYPYQYHVHYNEVVSINNIELRKGLDEFTIDKVHAVAGIGYPNRFFSLLEQAGLQLIPHALPDHHKFKASDLDFNDTLPIIMTEKDAVKCQTIDQDNMWYLPIQVVPNDKLEQRITTLLEGIV